MALPLKYNFRNVFVRWRTTAFTVAGIGAVVAVFVLLQALARGIEATSGNTGDPRNILVVRRGSQAESGSLVSRDHFRTLQYFDEVARNDAGEPIISAELIMIVSAPRRAGNGEANTLVRGVTPRGMELRPQVKLTAGRWFNPGHREVVVAERLAKRFEGFELGGTIKAGPDRLSVVGHFDAAGSAFDSEAWMDADESRSLFDREQYSSILIRPRDAAAGAALIAKVDQDKRLSLRAEREVDYYAKQTMTAMPFKILRRDEHHVCQRRFPDPRGRHVAGARLLAPVGGAVLHAGRRPAGLRRRAVWLRHLAGARLLRARPGNFLRHDGFPVFLRDHLPVPRFARPRRPGAGVLGADRAGGQLPAGPARRPPAGHLRPQVRLSPHAFRHD
jgi:hypothetical protein